MKMYKQNRITKVGTPKGLASALSFPRGVQNTMVHLVEYNCDTMDQWAHQIEPTSKKAQEYFSRANYIYIMQGSTLILELSQILKT